MTPIVRTPDRPAVQEQFEALARHWLQETELLSSTTAMTGHPAYQAIIALGSPVVPLLLRALEREPAHWFEALRAITGQDPVAPAHWGNISAMRTDWLTWGQQRGLI